MSICCCIKLGALVVLTPIYGIAWLASPSLRKAVREHKAKEDAEHEKEMEKMREIEKSLDEFKERYEASERARMIRQEKMMVNPDFCEKVEKMVRGGIRREDAIRSCVAQSDREFISKRTKDLTQEGIPRSQAYKMASNELNRI
jgi:hypothetical protein